MMMIMMPKHVSELINACDAYALASADHSAYVNHGSHQSNIDAALRRLVSAKSRLDTAVQDYADKECK